MIKLVLSDMDNTLIPFGHKRASQRTIDAIHAAQEQGIDVGPATGRNRTEIASFFNNDASCYNTGVLCNGQRVYFNGQIVDEVQLDWSLLRKVERVALDVPGMALVVYHDNGEGECVGATKEEIGSMYEAAFKTGAQFVSVLPEFPAIKAGIIFMGTSEETQALQARLQAQIPEFDFPNTVPHWMDVTPHGCSKVDGVKRLVAALHLQMEEVCVFGDADNDLSMLLWVPHSCAVANANEHARACAAHQVPASEDDGVAWALDQITEAARIYNETGEELLPRFMQ